MGQATHSLREKTIDYIIRNRVSAVEVADALFKQGVLPDIHAYNRGHFAVGPVHYVYAHSESNWPLHEQIQEVPENCILFVDAFNCKDRAILGSIVAKYVFLYKQIRGLVINGHMRDAHRMRKENYPVWVRGVTPLGCFNKEVRETEALRKEVQKRRKMFEGSVMICDDSGCTQITPELLTEKTLKRLEFIEMQEDIWEFCTDTLKWSTYETICLKRYLREPNVIPEALRKQMEKIDGD